MFNESLIYGLILVIFLFISVEFFVSTLKHKTLGYKLLSFNIFIYILLFLSEALQIFTIDLHYRICFSSIRNDIYNNACYCFKFFIIFISRGKIHKIKTYAFISHYPHSYDNWILPKLLFQFYIQ